MIATNFFYLFYLNKKYFCYRISLILVLYIIAFTELETKIYFSIARDLGNSLLLVQLVYLVPFVRQMNVLVPFVHNLTFPKCLQTSAVLQCFFSDKKNKETKVETKSEIGTRLEQTSLNAHHHVLRNGKCYLLI